MKTINLYGIEYPAISLKLSGLTPLLMHKAAGNLQSHGPAKKRVPTPEEEAEAGTYRDDNGNLVFPTSGIRSSIIKAASNYKLGKKSFATVLSSVLFTVEEFAPITRNGQPIRDYIIDKRRVVVQRGGVIRARPCIELTWQIDVTFALDYPGDVEQFAAVLLEAANMAGRAVGIGDFRPEKRGFFGRYSVELQ